MKSSIKLILFDVLATARTLFLAVCVFICLFSLLIEEAYGAINASRIYQLQQRLIENPRDVESHLNIAMEYGAANDFLKAVEAYFTLLRVDPNNFHAYNNLGVLYKKSGQYRDSLHCYEQAEKIAPESAWVPYNKGLCYEAMGRMQEARESYGRALSLDPSFSQALQRLRILSGSEEQIASSQTFEEAQILIAVSPRPEPTKIIVKTEPIKPQPKTEVKTDKISSKLQQVKDNRIAKKQHRTQRKGAAATIFNKAMDAFESNNLEKAIELYVTAITSERDLLAEPENGLIKAALEFLKERPNRMPEGLFYRGILIYISGHIELASKDFNSYLLSSGKNNLEYVDEAKRLLAAYETEKAALEAARKAQKEHEALIAAKELAAKSSIEDDKPRPSDIIIQNMNVDQIIAEADRLSRDSRITDALAVIETGLKVDPSNIKLLMKSANAYTDLLLVKGDNEAGKMAILRFEKVYANTPENSREWSVAKDMIFELKKRVK